MRTRRREPAPRFRAVVLTNLPIHIACENPCPSNELSPAARVLRPSLRADADSKTGTSLQIKSGSRLLRNTRQTNDCGDDDHRMCRACEAWKNPASHGAVYVARPRTRQTKRSMSRTGSVERFESCRTGIAVRIIDEEVRPHKCDLTNSCTDRLVTLVHGETNACECILIARTHGVRRKDR